MKHMIHTILCVSLLTTMQTSFANFWHEGKDFPQKQVNKDLKSLNPKVYANVASANADAVVNIRVSKAVKGSNGQMQLPFGPPNLNEEFFEKFFGFKQGQPLPKREQSGLGSGFVISEQGYVVTNNHVVDGASNIMVIFSDEKEYEATIVGQDPKTDLALIKIEDKKKKFPAVILGDSDQLVVGDVVIAIGNPFGLSHTTTQGIVSAKERSIGVSAYDDFIQTDASINPGNSGGPLLNLNGEVVGINTAILASGQGLGFAIPINMAKDILLSLKEKGKVDRAWLGVNIQQVTPDHAKALNLKSNTGALVSEVVSNSPADKAGLKPGDVIVKFGDKDINKWTQLSAVVATSPLNKKISIKIIRDRQVLSPQVKLEKSKLDQMQNSADDTQKDTAKNNFDRLGLVIKNAPKKSKNDTGVLVANIKRSSEAFEKGLRQGDVILQMNQGDIHKISDYEKRRDALKPGDYVFLRVQKSQGILFITFAYEPEKN